MAKIKRFLPLITLLLLMGISYFSGLSDFFTFENLKNNKEQLKELVSHYSLIAPLSFISIYALSTALSFPGGLFLSLLGGFLFPQPFSTLYVVIGATTGAIALFLAAKTALGNTLKERFGPIMQKMEKGLHENGASYLLFLRLVPLFPFWLVNIAPAIFGVSLFTYSWTTFIGIIPGSFVFTQAGTGLGAIFDSGEAFSIATIFNNDIKIALVALGIFALLPVVIKRIRESYPVKRG